MKDRLKAFIFTYLLFVLVFVLQKPVFVLYYGILPEEGSAAAFFNIILHGLKLDASLAGYLTALPALMLIVSVFMNGKWLATAAKIYFGIVAVLLSAIFTVDMGLYEYWGFRLDATPLFYFFSSPKDALASVSVWTVVGGLLVFLVYAALLYLLFVYCLLRQPLKPVRRKALSAAVLVLLTGLLFIPIRGGFTVSTMNVGKVYFSSDMRLNHAATNPAFSLMESLAKQKDFSKQYRFMPEAAADSLFAEMTYVEKADSIDSLLTTSRPEILMIIMESFSSHLMTELGGEPDIAPNLDSISREGVLFTNFYANSFRTDRGLVSVLSGYPAQPTTSIMKYPRKTQSLPAIASALAENGYTPQYYYGGDADFTNMRSYLMASGFERIVSDVDFPVSKRLSKWGAHDDEVFKRLYNDMAADTAQGKRKFRVVQTSSSHEPFEVPYRRLANDRLNAFAFTDSIIGDFIRRFKELPQWQNTLVVLVPDHLGAYPENIDNLTPERYRIPLILTGGAVKAHRRIDAYGSQQDIAATLLAQFGVEHSDFVFSKDALDTKAPHFAFFTVPDAMGIADSCGTVIYDNVSGKVAFAEGDTAGIRRRAEAYLQKLYDDLSKR